jgi:hypothetical protein
MKKISILFLISILIAGISIGVASSQVNSQTGAQQPAVTLTPSLGFAATTVSGTGFFGVITISWDGQVIPTVPSPLYSGDNGGFTAIITVPTQTALGTHTIQPGIIRLLCR